MATPLLSSELPAHTVSSQAPRPSCSLGTVQALAVFLGFLANIDLVLSAPVSAISYHNSSTDGLFTGKRMAIVGTMSMSASLVMHVAALAMKNLACKSKTFSYQLPKESDTSSYICSAAKWHAATFERTTFVAFVVGLSCLPVALGTIGFAASGGICQGSTDGCVKFADGAGICSGTLLGAALVNSVLTNTLNRVGKAFNHSIIADVAGEPDSSKKPLLHLDTPLTEV